MSQKPSGGVIEKVSFAAFGGTAVVAVTDPDAAPAAEAAVREVVEQFDLACSRFRLDSELERLNARRGGEFRAGPVLLEAVQAGLRAAELTDGMVDPALGRVLVALGYDRDFDQLEGEDDELEGEDDELAGTDDALSRPSPRIVARPGWTAIRIDPARQTITLPREVSLDLGATAKALAADRAAAVAQQASGAGVLVSLSGDVAIAGEAPEQGWPVLVTDDHRASLSAPGQRITLTSGGLATSSTSVRRWRRDGQTIHHLIDPATGRPAEAIWRTASVAADSCLDANIASTAAMIMGAQAINWLSERGLPSRLVSREGHVLHLAGWPTRDEDLPSLSPYASVQA